MKSYRGLAFIVPFLALAGCAAYELEPLAVDHPANPAARPAANLPVSKTLAYTGDDLSSLRPAGDERLDDRGAHSSEPDARQTVVGEGMVVATVPGSGQLVIEHGKIEGFMDAMTMGYRVESPSLLEELNSGDRVRFTIDVPKKAIIKIEKLQ